MSSAVCGIVRAEHMLNSVPVPLSFVRCCFLFLSVSVFLYFTIMPVFLFFFFILLPTTNNVIIHMKNQPGLMINWVPCENKSNHDSVCVCECVYSSNSSIDGKHRAQLLEAWWGQRSKGSWRRRGGGGRSLEMFSSTCQYPLLSLGKKHLVPTSNHSHESLSEPCDGIIKTQRQSGLSGLKV